MLSPRNAQIIAVLLAISFLIGTPFQAARAQTGASKPQDPPQSRKNSTIHRKLSLSNS